MTAASQLVYACSIVLVVLGGLVVWIPVERWSAASHLWWAPAAVSAGVLAWLVVAVFALYLLAAGLRS